MVRAVDEIEKAPVMDRWQAVSLGKVAQVIMGQSPPGSSYNRQGIGSPLINGPTEFTDKHPIKMQWTSQPTKLAQPGDLLLCVRGSSTGRTNVSDDRYCIGRGIAAIRAKQVADQRFIAFQVESGISRLLRLTTGSTFPNINSQSIGAISLLLPPRNEQSAIATVLSDIDSLIESLERLIAKKRAIKQGAMQELLTGKRRLPGFKKKWHCRKFGDVLTVRHGRSQRGISAHDGKYPILASGGIIGRTNTPLYTKPSVLIGRKGTIDRPQYQSGPFWTVDTLFYTEICQQCSPKFLYYLFSTIDWRTYNEASGVPSLNASTIEQIEFNSPDLDEQHAIATIVSHFDDELELEFRRLTKYIAMKQGMMQVLLTGRIRLLKD